MDPDQSEFTLVLVACQPRLKAYIRTLVMDRDMADEVVQRTNLILCEKGHEFKPGTDFAAWACKIGYIQILSYRQRFARERKKLVFDDEKLGEIAAVVEADMAAMQDDRRLLRECIAKLPEKQRDLIRRRYVDGEGTQAIAEQLNRPVGSIRQTLFRIRLVLLDCARSGNSLRGAQ